LEQLLNKQTQGDQMRQLTVDEKIFLEELLVNVKEVEILVWDDTKTDTVKSMILQIGRKAKEKRDVSEFHEREQIKIARHAKARGDTPSPKSQPSLFLTSMYGIAYEGEFREGVSVVPIEMQARLDRICISINRTLNAYSE
jgi:hypothetical protein